MRKKYLILGAHMYARPFQHLGMKLTTDPRVLDLQIDDVGLVVFTGGEDVSPFIYGHTKHWSTRNNVGRDAKEIAAFEKARKAKIPVIGICRGAQFICVMAGGHLVQDMSGHSSENHKLRYIKEDRRWGLKIVDTSPEPVTSTHHQMQYPFRLKEREQYRVLAWSDSPRSRNYVFDGVTYTRSNATANMLVEPDVVEYPEIRGLGIQYHPEYMNKKSWGFIYAKDLISCHMRTYANLPSPIATKI